MFRKNSRELIFVDLNPDYRKTFLICLCGNGDNNIEITYLESLNFANFAIFEKIREIKNSRKFSKNTDFKQFFEEVSITRDFL